MQISKINLSYPVNLHYHPVKNMNKYPENTEVQTIPCKSRNLHYTYFTGSMPKNRDEIRNEVIETIKSVYEEQGFDAETIERISNRYKDFNDEKILLAYQLIKDNRYKNNEIPGIIAAVNDYNISVARKICSEKPFGVTGITNTINQLTPQNINFVEKLWDTKDFPREMFPIILIILADSVEKYGHEEEQGIPYFVKMYQQCQKNPEAYISAEDSNIDEKCAVSRFFRSNPNELFKLCSLQNNELNDILLRKRFSGCKTYLAILKKFDKEQMDMLKKALNCNSSEGKKLTPPEKLEMIKLINALSICKMGYDNFAEMINTGEINIYQIKEDIITQVMNNCYENSEQFKTMTTPDKVQAWDINNAYLLSKELQKSGREEFINIIKLANRPEEFKTLIKNTPENIQTAKIFDENGLDYDKWLTPSNKSNVRIKIVDNNATQLRNIERAFTENVNELLDSPVKGYIRKKYPQYTQKEIFELPKEITESKSMMIEFMKNFIKELEPVWERAEHNKTGAKREQALHTLTIKDHFKTFIIAAENIETIHDKKDLDLTIKMWNRFPQHDLFQGNYSTCCIGLGNVNSYAMPEYLKKTAFNMIEIIDNTTGETVGNALCYYAKEYDKPVLVLDNIEINNSFKPSDLSCKYIREGLKEYGKRLNKEVTGQANTPIYLGKNYNDVPTEDLLIKKEARLKFIGELRDENSEDSYLDAFGGWRDTDKICKYPFQTNLYKLA